MKYKHLAEYWHEESPELVGQALIATMESILADQENHYENQLYYARLYKDSQRIDWIPGNYDEDAIDNLLDEEPITYNIVRVCVDTLQSKITLHKPTPKLLTSQGSESLQEAAKDAEKFIGGVFYENDIYEKAKRAFRDACLYGMGILKVFESNMRVKAICVHPSRIVIDNQAALTSEPAFLGHYEHMDKDSLMDMFPDKKDVIEKASQDVVGHGSTHPRKQVKVFEGYKKKIGDKVGRHVIAVDSGALLDEEYHRECFPYVVLRYQDDVLGWYGIGVAEQLRGIQEEMNTITRKVQSNFNLLSVPYILKHRGSQIHDEHIANNEEARIVEWSGNQPPEIVTPPAVHPQTFEYLERLWQKGFEIIGISQLSATSQKQPGLNAAVAIRTHLDVETQRFSILSKRWEALFVELGKRIIELAQDICLRNEEGYKVQYPDKQFLGEINFKDLDLQKDQFVLKVHSASALPMSPAGRMERVIEMLNAQMVSPEEARQLIDFPDLEKFNRLATAHIDDLEMVFEHMLSKGKYIEPLVYQNLEMGIQLGTSYYLRGKLDGISERRLDLVLRWLDEAKEIIDSQIETEAAPAAPQQQPQGLPPQGLSELQAIPGGLQPSMLPQGE